MDALATRADLVARTNGADADGEVVWSWRPDAGAKRAERSARDGGKKARSPGRVRRKPLKPSRREGRMFGQACGDCRLLFLLQAGHGCGLHPAFPAPSSSRGHEIDARLGRVSAARRRNHVRRRASRPRPLFSRRGIAIIGLIDTSCALDIRAGAAYEDRLAQPSPQPRCPRRKAQGQRSGLRAGHELG